MEFFMLRELKRTLTSGLFLDFIQASNPGPRTSWHTYCTYDSACRRNSVPYHPNPHSMKHGKRQAVAPTLRAGLCISNCGSVWKACMLTARLNHCHQRGAGRWWLEMCVHIMRKGANIGSSSRGVPLLPPGTNGSTSWADQSSRQTARAHWCLWHRRRGQAGFAPLYLGNWSSMKDPWKALMPKASWEHRTIHDRGGSWCFTKERKPVKTARPPISKTKSIFLPQRSLLFL